MSATDWERQFEDCAAREREAMIELVDASRALTGAFRPAGATQADAAGLFAEKYVVWRSAAEAITQLAEAQLPEK